MSAPGKWDAIRSLWWWAEVRYAGPPEWEAAWWLRAAFRVVAPWRPREREWWS